MSKEAMKLALEALKEYCEHGAIFMPFTAVKALEEALAKQEQGEPVGEILLTNGDYKEVSWKNGKLPPIGAKLYTTLQPAQKPMMEEQIFGCITIPRVISRGLTKGVYEPR